MTNEATQKDLSAEVEELRQRLSVVEGYCLSLAEVMQQFFLLFPPPGGPGPSVLAPISPKDAQWWKGTGQTGSLEGPKEHPVPGWEHLVIRRHPWRRELYLKGRNLTVRQLLGTVKANGWSEEDAAKNLDLPVEAIREAVRYEQENQALLKFEGAYERLILAREGYSCGAEPVP